MASNNHRVSLALTAVMALAPVTAQATIERSMAFDDKVENASAIVLGRVVAQESHWDAAHKWVLTYSTFRVEKTLKGQEAQEVTIVTPGGTVGTVAQEVIGAPKFRQGDDHLVFVRDSKAGPTVLYLEQGAYRVENNDRGERMVNPLVTNAVLIDTQSGTAVAPEHARPLREFENEVRQTIRRREANQMEMMKRRQQEQASLWGQVQRNKTLVIVALLGALLATWQFMKRT